MLSRAVMVGNEGFVRQGAFTNEFGGMLYGRAVYPSRVAAGPVRSDGR